MAENTTKTTSKEATELENLIDGLMETIKTEDLDREDLYNLLYKATFQNYLTGCWNSGGIANEIARIAETEKLTDYDSVSLNIMGFSLVNAEFGPEESDQILIRYTRYLENRLPEGDVLAHLGADNFVAFVHRSHTLSLIENVKLVHLYSEKDGQEFPVNLTTRVGIFPVRDANASPQEILTGAAMAQAVARRRNVEQFVMDDVTQNRFLREKIIARNFSDALEHGRIQAFYQPKVNTKTREIIGVEALTRWFTRDGKILSPAEYVPILEENGHIMDLDLFMLQLVCKDIALYAAAGNEIVPASVNFSRKDFYGPGRSPRILADSILSVIRESGISHEYIVVEVTESMEEQEKEDLYEFLEYLREAGVKSSVDDFGTGYSSLSVLRDMSVDEIKIDRSFINHEKLSKKDEIIIRSIINMAKELGIDVITEGVENEEQIEFLHRLGCDRVQGYYFDKPLPKEKFEERLQIRKYTKVS